MTVTTNVDTPLGSLNLMTSVTFNGNGNVASVESQTSGTLLGNANVVASGGPAPAAAANNPVAASASGGGVPFGGPAPAASSSGGGSSPAAVPSTGGAGGGSYSVAVSTSGLEVVHDIAADHVTFLAAAAGTGLSVSQSAILDVAFKNFSQIRSQIHGVAALRRLTRDLGTFAAR